MDNSETKSDNAFSSGANRSDDGSYDSSIHYQAALDAGFALNTEDGQERVLYIGNLDKTVTEELITGMFEENSKIAKVKVISNTSPPVFAFVEFEDHDAALRAINNNKPLNCGIKIQLVTRQNASTAPSFDVFIGNLSLDVDKNALRQAFMPFGEVFGVKVIYDHVTLKNKGYGFVSYSTREEAQHAIDQMNGMVLSGKPIHTTWALRRTENAPNFKVYRPKTYDEIFTRTAPGNTTIFVGNMPKSASEEEIHNAFGRFGFVVEMRVFRQQGYSFIKFDTQKSAAYAILNMDNEIFKGKQISCWWGKPVFRTQTREFNEHTKPNLGQQHMQQAYDKVPETGDDQYGFNEYGKMSAEQQQHYDHVFVTDEEQQYGSGDAGMIVNGHQQNWQQQYYQQQYYSNPFVQYPWQVYGYQPTYFVNYPLEAPQHQPAPSQY